MSRFIKLTRALDGKPFWVLARKIDAVGLPYRLGEDPPGSEALISTGRYELRVTETPEAVLALIAEVCGP